LVALLSAPLVFVLVQQPMRLGTRRARPARNAIFTVSTEPGSKVHFASLTLLQLTNHEDLSHPGSLAAGKTANQSDPTFFFHTRAGKKEVGPTNVSAVLMGWNHGGFGLGWVQWRQQTNRSCSGSHKAPTSSSVPSPKAAASALQ